MNIKKEAQLIADRFAHVVVLVGTAVLTLPLFFLLALVEWFQVGKQVHSENWPKGD